MEVVHIAELDKTKETEAGFLVTYFLTKEEFEELQTQAAEHLEANEKSNKEVA